MSKQSEQDRKQREHAKKSEKGELPWQKAQHKSSDAAVSEIEFQPRGSKKEIPIEKETMPLREVRKFPNWKVPNWEVPELMEAAQTLYVATPSTFWRGGKLRYKSLAKQAADF